MTNLFIYLRPIKMVIIFLFIGTQVSAQKNSSEQVLQQMVDSVNYLLKNCEDAYVQPVFSINQKGDISLLDAKESGFRFHITSLGSQDSSQTKKTGIAFVPERSRSITTNKFIYFIDKQGKNLGLLKFTRTTDDYVRIIYDLLVRIRSYFTLHYSS